MKVAYFLGALNRGGMESLILDVCKYHLQLHMDAVCIYRKEGSYSEEFQKTGVPMIRISRKKTLLFYLLNLRKIVRKEKVAIIHSQTPSNTLICAIALMGMKVRIITTYHGIFENASNAYLRLISHLSNLVICVSEYCRDYYVRQRKVIPENKVRVVYNGIDNYKMLNSKPLQEFSCQPQKKRLVMVGNFVGGRAQYEIVQSIIELKNKGRNDFEMYFVGKKVESEAFLYEKCVHLCQEHNLNNVHFLGSRSDVSSILKSMDIFVYSTINDTFGIAVIEAMMLGLPIVVNDWAVMKEVCNVGQSKQTNSVYFYPSRDINTCAHAIDYVLDHIQEMKENATKLAPLVQEKYSIQKHISQLEIVYKEEEK